HFEAISNEELKVIEEKVNNVILSSLDIKCDIMNIKEAKEKGANIKLWVNRRIRVWTIYIPLS
ncbi:hypothetical protein ACTPEF_26535, partial [Clostridioides difficile]